MQGPVGGSFLCSVFVDISFIKYVCFCALEVRTSAYSYFVSNGFPTFNKQKKIKKKLSLGGQIYGIKPAWSEGEFYFYLVVLSGQQASSPTNTFHACGMVE